MKLFLLFYFFIFAASIEAASFYTQLKNQGEEKYWLKLLHYKENTWNNLKGGADGDMFYLHSHGKTSPEKELEATIKAFDNHSIKIGYAKQHPQCAFPERYRFLKKIKLTNAKKVQCHDFIEWKKGLNAKSITLVFSSAYPNNPSSMFGHTFIRFNQKNKKNDLLDYTAAFSANVDPNDSGIIYALKGIFGGYPGRVSFTPYYQKTNEYNNSESRDIFEYNLNIPTKRVNILINHLWEIFSNTYFDYYFLDENCSWLLGAMLEVAMPSWNLTNSRWYYLPQDLIYQLKQIDKSILKINYRPALYKQVTYQIENLNNKQYTNLIDAFNGKKEISQINDFKTLDSLISILSFQKFDTENNISNKQRKLFRSALLKRSQIKEKSSKIIYPTLPDASYAHRPMKFSLSSGFDKHDNIYELQYKSGFHDLLASDAGIGNFLEFDFLSLSLLYNQAKQHTYLSHLNFVNIISLHPYNFFDNNFSWTAGGNISRTFSLINTYNHKWNGFGGIGFHFELGTPNLTTNIMILANIEISKYFHKGYRVGPSVSWAVLTRPFNKYKFQLKYSLLSDTKHSIKKAYYQKIRMNHSFHFKQNMDIRFKSEYISRFQSFSTNHYQHQLTLGYYF